MMSYRGVPVEEIARLAGHASLRTTEVVYRRELRPVITTALRSWTRSSSPSSGGKPLQKPPDEVVVGSHLGGRAIYCCDGQRRVIGLLALCQGRWGAGSCGPMSAADRSPPAHGQQVEAYLVCFMWVARGGLDGLVRGHADGLTSR